MNTFLCTLPSKNEKIFNGLLTYNYIDIIIKVVSISPHSAQWRAKTKKSYMERKEEVIMMNNKLPYEDAEIEVVFFSTEDIVTASTMSNVDTGDDSWV